MKKDTLAQYDIAFTKCREIFEKKTKDYGTSWRMFRITSVTDQLYIKAKRIRTVDEKGEQMIDDHVNSEFMACVNYGIIGLIQLELGDELENGNLDLDVKNTLKRYDEQKTIVRDLMIAKNHDYGEAWREMRLSSYTDMILTKLHRIKQIEENDGQTEISEGVEGHYRDIVNYAIFALIRIQENENQL